MLRKWSYRAETIQIVHGAAQNVAAVQFLAVRKYSRRLYQGTISHFIIMPMLDKTVTIRIHGSRKDSERIWAIAQTVLTRNPDARLEELQ